MVDVALQINSDGTLKPYALEDREALSDFMPNQIVRAKITGATKARSYPQLKLYFVICKIVADNLDDPEWSDKNKVSFQVKVALRFYDRDKSIVDEYGTRHIVWRSVSYKNLKHLEACNYFNKAYDFLSDKLGCSVEELLIMGEEAS